MKKFIILLSILSIIPINKSHAQSITGFQYQTTVKDAQGSPITPKEVKIRFTILKNAAENGKTVYEETHTTQPNTTGLISLQIGTGQATIGNFNLIDWSGKHYVKSEFDLGEGFYHYSVQELLNVPYALSAEKTLGLKSADGTNWNLMCDKSGVISTIKVPERFSQLVFHDEFDQTGLPDESKWSFEEGFVRNGEKQYYTVKRIENCYQKDGYLYIDCLNDSAEIKNALVNLQWNYPWSPIRKDTVVALTSASIHTRNKFAFTYGRVEMRAKLPLCKGTWSAIWMMPQDDKYGYWPNSGEIDIMEHVGFQPNTAHYTLHSQTYNSGTKPKNPYSKTANISFVNTEFHVYAIEWHEDRMEFYLDGVLEARIKKSPSYTWKEWPFHHDFYLILNSALGGGWGGDIDYTGLPQSYIIDYVRIYQ